MADSIAVSLLIPIYNVERYLPEALDSAIGQTLREIEIICIDDGSTDNSSTIIDHYAAMDPRIRVIHKSNGGYGNAMNTGMELAKGDYIAILEPDDLMDRHMLADLYRIAEAQPVDFVKSDFAFLEGTPEHYHITPMHVHWDRKLYGRVLCQNERLELFRGRLAHWACLYRRSFLEGHLIRFHESPGASYQDTGFWFLTMSLASSIYLHNGCYYRYRQDNPESSMADGNKMLRISGEYDFIYRQLEKRSLLNIYWPQFVAHCFSGHRDALHRIAECHKKDLVNHIASYFGRLREENRLDISFMEVQDRKMLEEILLDAKKFYSKLTSVPDFLHDRLAPYHDFYIYGAGARGKKIYHYLQEADKKRCLGFLVTKADGYTQVLGKPVYAANMVSISKQTGILLGVTEHYRKEITDSLSQRGIHTAIFLPEDNVP